MPLEIRELIIRTHITTPEDRLGRTGHTANLSEEDRQRIVQDCVHQVLRHMRKRNER